MRQRLSQYKHLTARCISNKSHSIYRFLMRWKMKHLWKKIICISPVVLLAATVMADGKRCLTPVSECMQNSHTLRIHLFNDRGEKVQDQDVGVFENNEKCVSELLS